MGKRKDVGVSDSRTPGKHYLLKRVIGAEIGVLSVPKMAWLARNPYVILDLCAGNGAPTDASDTSSPQILLHYANQHRTGGRLAHVILTEKKQAIFDRLRSNLPGHGFDPQYDVACLGDARTPGLIPTLWTPDSAMFIHNDPNTVDGYAITPELMARVPRHTTSLSTLGCNAGGFKRGMPLSQRVDFFEHALRVPRAMPSYHDALLVRLAGDSAQFAWIITGPTGWLPRYAKNVTAAFKNWPYGLTTASYRQGHAEFLDLCDQLFLTEKEREAA